MSTPTTRSDCASAAAGPGSAWAVALGLAAGWVAAGSCGVVAGCLQTLGVWFLLIPAALLARPRYESRTLVMAAVALVLLLLVPRAIGLSTLHLPLVVAVVLAVLALGLQGLPRQLLWAAGMSVLGLSLFRLAQLQVPAWWIMTDRLGTGLGWLAGRLTGQPLHIGASFAGLDFLVVMLLFWIGLLPLMRTPRSVATLSLVACVLLAQAVYLVVLAFTPRLADALPPAAAAVFDNPYVPPAFSWSTVARQMLPWNLPVLAAVLHALTVVFLIRSTPWAWPAESVDRSRNLVSSGWRRCVAVAPLLVALVLALVSSLNLCSGFLTDKRVVAVQQENLDFQTAQHDQYGADSAGMFGLLPQFTQSLGAELQVVSQLTPDMLRQTDLLLLLHPNEDRLSERELVWQYLRGGGSVLVVTHGFDPQFGLDSVLADLLDGTAISVAQDAAISEADFWQESAYGSLHAGVTQVGVPNPRCYSDTGASLRISWGARPLLVGRWGWSAPQQEATWSEAQPMRTGAKLGDLVLAAEQRVGRGRLVVLGSNWPVSNEGLVQSYPLTGNLLACLAQGIQGAQAVWRQILGVCGGILLWVILLRRRDALLLVAVSALLAVSLAGTHAWGRYHGRVLPDGRRIVPPATNPAGSRVAYIDSSHLESFSFEHWGFEATNGLTLNLMRNGYLPLLMPQLTAERLEGAGLVVSIAPARTFTPAECRTLREFVDRGGVLICTVGAEESAASTPLLAEFGLWVPPSPVPTGVDSVEPEPFGRTRALYLNVDVAEDDSYQVGMRLHAGWPVESLDGAAEIIAYGRNQLRVVNSDTELPVVLQRRMGAGVVVLIGDSGFALNKNLEYIGGEPFAGGYENAHFWRWLLTRLAEQPEWVPPRPVAGETADTTEEEE